MSFLDKYRSIGREDPPEEDPGRRPVSVLDKYRLSGKSGPRSVFPPPPAGSIPQAKVYPEATGDEASLLNLANTGVSEFYKNQAAMVAAPFQAARHPVATALDIIPATVNTTMSLAEMLTPIDAGGIPGHETVSKIDESLRQRIASDAPTKEIGQYASAVPDIIGTKLPLGGITHAKGVAKAGGIAPYLKAQKAAAGASLGKAAAGRKIIEGTLPTDLGLETMRVRLSNPNYAKALAFIDDPQAAPVGYIQQLATDLNKARANDVANWASLSRRQQEALSGVGNFKGSSDLALQQLYQNVRATKFNAAASPALNLISDKGRGLVAETTEYMRSLGEKFLSRPGTQRVLAGRTQDPIAKEALLKGLPQKAEEHTSIQRAAEGLLDEAQADLTFAIAKEAGGDLKKADQLVIQTWKLATGRTLPSLSKLSPEIADATREFFKARLHIERLNAEAGIYSPAELKQLTRGQTHARGLQERLRNVYKAAHDKDYAQFARDKIAWKKLHASILKAHPNANPREIDGIIERLVSQEVAYHFEKNGLLPPKIGGESIGSHPLLQGLSQRDTDLLIPAVMGRVKSLPHAGEMIGEVAARLRAQRVVQTDTFELLRKAGLLSETPISNQWVNLRKLPKKRGLDANPMRLGYDMYAPPELAHYFSNAEEVARTQYGLMRALTKVGAFWRAGSSVYSPLTTVQSSVSNIGGALASGEALRPGFIEGMRHALGQAWDVFKRGGTAAKDRDFEFAMARRGLGPGTISGELGNVFAETGLVPKIRGEMDIPNWARRGRFFPDLGLDPGGIKGRKVFRAKNRVGRAFKDAFEQGDIAPKRAVASLIAKDFDDMIRAATPGDLQRIFTEMWGGTNPGEIAADMTSNLLQSYQRVSQGVRDIGRGPFMGLFSSFPYESARNFGWGIKYLAKELKSAAIAESPAVRAMMVQRASRRMAGLSLNMKMLSELGEMAEEAIGPDLSDDQKEALREVVLPPWDRGPSAFLGKDGSKYSYMPAGNVEYFGNVRNILSHAGAMVGSAFRGEWNRVDDHALDLLVRASDDFLQFQQPLRGIAEAALNRRLPGSPGSLLADFGKRPVALSNSPIMTENWEERLREGVIPGVVPTFPRQIADLVTGERSLAEINPIGRRKEVDSLQQLGIAGQQYADQRQVYNKKIGEIMREPTSPEQKARELMALERDWNDDFGPKLARNLKMWRRLHSVKEVRDAMQELGYASANPAMKGQVPVFRKVFSASIPGRVKFFMKGER